MWNDQKRQRFRELRLGGQLNEFEQVELAALVKELEDEEAAYLKPSAERLRRENELTERQNTELDKLIKRKEALVQRLKNVLAETRAEQRAIANELANVLAAAPNSDSGD